MKKNVCLVMCMMFIMTFTLSAQQPRMNKAKTPQNCERRIDNRKGHLTPQMRADRMATELGLTDAEKLKVKLLFEKEDANRVKRMDENQGMRNEVRAKADGDRKSKDAELEKIIGKEKFQKMTEKREEMKSKMADRQKTNRKKHSNSPGKMNKGK